MVTVAFDPAADPEKVQAELRTIQERMSAAVNECMAGVDPLDIRIIKCLLSAKSSHDNPSYDGRIVQLRNVIVGLMGVIEELRPGQQQFWSDWMNKCESAVVKVESDIQREYLAATPKH